MAKLVDLSKTQLGKLLASENIRIEHRQIRGPYFDVKDRVLALPIWTDVSNDLYDLMIGHEVGHALFTPAEGWEDEVKTKQNLKTFLNIIEDARIEKKMKRKYPGLRKPMYNGYTELVERGFFGMNFDEMQEMPFVDRLNVHFKLGSRANIQFTDKEQDFITRVEAVETWDEVMVLANELYDITEKEKEDKEEEFALIDETEDSDDVENSDIRDEAAGTQSVPSQDSPESDANTQQDKDTQESTPDKKPATTEFVENVMREWAYSDAPTSITHDAMKRHEESLIDENAYPMTYTYWPDLNLKDWVVPAKVTYDNMVFDTKFEKTGDTLYNNFMADNRRYISYMVKEFELRRNAKQFAKAKVSKTGELDIKKIWKYRLSDDLFLQSTTVPNGKNHGMLMVVDMSSSMQTNMKGTIEQVINMALFCRKVNIPFEVYGFIDNNYAKMDGMNVDGESGGVNIRSRNDAQDKTLYINNVYFRLKELLNSKMKFAEFNMCVKKLLLLAKGYEKIFSYYNNAGYLVPPSMQLSGTPLNETILVLRHVAEKFKRETKVEILNTIILTDGDASYFPCHLSDNEIKQVHRFNTVVEDKLSTKRVLLKGNSSTLALLQLYKEITGSRVIGFYLMCGRDFKRQVRDKVYYTENFNYDQFETQYKKEFLNHKYFGVKMQGYDVYYMVPGEDLEVEHIDMNKVMKPTDKMTKNTLFRAFKKMQSTKMTSRVFLNQFIMQVA